MKPFAGQPDDLARLDVALESRADQVERAGLGRHDGRSLADAERERPDAVRIPHGEDPVAGKDHDRITAADLEQRLRDGARQGRRLGAGDEVKNDLRVGRGREEGARLLEVPPDLPRVDEVAVVREGERAAARREHDRLGVDQKRAARRRVADVPDGRPAGQPRQPGLVEDVRDVAHLALDVDLALVVERGDPRRLLAPVLERVEPEVGEVGGVLRVADAEDAALVVRSRHCLTNTEHRRNVLNSDRQDFNIGRPQR